MAAQIWKQVYTSILPECCKVKAWKCDSQPFLKHKKTSSYSSFYKVQNSVTEKKPLEMTLLNALVKHSRAK